MVVDDDVVVAVLLEPTNRPKGPAGEWIRWGPTLCISEENNNNNNNNNKGSEPRNLGDTLHTLRRYACRMAAGGAVGSTGSRPRLVVFNFKIRNLLTSIIFSVFLKNLMWKWAIAQ